MIDFTDPIYKRALEGDKEATKMYCGSYMLVRRKYNKLVKDLRDVYRYKGDKPPNGYVEVKLWYGEPVYDKDGFLISRFWSVARLEVNERT
jgi:hypothetical protein